MKQSTTKNTIRLTVDRTRAGRTLQDFLAEQRSLSRRGAKELIDSRGVFVNGRRVWMARHALRAGDVVELAAPAVSAAREAPPLPQKLPVLYDKAGLIVVHKPPALTSEGADSAESVLRSQSGCDALRAVHRLDRDTSGCLLLARTPALREACVERFEKRSIMKLYHVLVQGRFPEAERTVRHEIEGEAAVTHLKVLDSNDDATHLLARIETGRTHQIRRHLAVIGYPVLGDRQYGTSQTVRDPRVLRVPRQMLHAAVIDLEHPELKHRIRVEAPLPADFRLCMRAFKLT